MKQAYIKNGKVVSVQTPSPQVRDGHIKIKVEYSTISAGTEMTSVKATEKGIFRRAMEDSGQSIESSEYFERAWFKKCQSKSVDNFRAKKFWIFCGPAVLLRLVPM